MGEPLLHVLVINWNGVEHLEACFSSLCASGYGHAEFVLVDNASEDGSIEFVQEQFGGDPRVVVFPTGGNLGWGGGNNAGLERAMEAGADYAFLINNDAAIEPGALEAAVDAAEAHPRVGALAPKMLLFDTPEVLNSIGLECAIIGGAWDRGLGRADGPAWDEAVRVPGFCGGACLLRMEAVRQVGLFPEDFRIYLDDLDMGLRMWDAGWEVRTCPEARVRHKYSATMGQGKRLRTKYYLNTRNRFRIPLRNYPFGLMLKALPALARGEVKSLGRAVLDGDWWKLAAHAKAWAAACAYAPKARRERRQRPYGVRGRFADVLRRDTLFFPGCPLPHCGWYAPVDIGGEKAYPIGKRARWETPGGPLRVRSVACYAHLRPARVEIRQAGRLLTETGGGVEGAAELNLAPGEVVFESQSLFEAGPEGPPFDTGAWLVLDETPV